MPNERAAYTAFIENGESRRDTARFLTDLADEHHVDQRSIQAVSGGFRITDELADLIGGEDDSATGEDIENVLLDDEASTTKTSGNRAGKTKNSKNSKEES